jgi:signal transduction histidine kinase
VPSAQKVIELPFKVSARTARLIGRENVSNSEGALIELVKNCYDADSSFCIIHFDRSGNLNILDNGTGMSSEVIRTHWMTIGTNHKEIAIKSSGGRVRTGAKGIGRFALDKLGEKCELYTFHPKSSENILWKVNWNDFESQKSTVIDDIKASLEFLAEDSFDNFVKAKFSRNTEIVNGIEGHKMKSGTLISIKGLRDPWTKKELDNVFKGLSSLIPPREDKFFQIFLFSDVFPSEYGEVVNELFEDYDYKLIAECDDKKNIVITLFRNEFDVDKIDKRVFRLNEFKKFPYDKNTFFKKSFKQKYTAEQLLPGFSDTQQYSELSKIGSFKFTLYFLKRGMRTPDQVRFFYKDIKSDVRSKWLDEYGGIRIYRDGFRVRPYGEPQSGAYDWLSLAIRHQTNTAGVASKTDTWKVREQNLSGVLEISRITSPIIDDRANREGIQETPAFALMRDLLVKIIEVFEKDRRYVTRGFDRFFEENNKTAHLEEQVDKIRDKHRKKKIGKNASSEEIEIKLLSEHSDQLEFKIEELVSEAKILRAMASSGAMVASFVHELNGIKSHLIERNKTAKELILPLIDKVKLSQLPKHRNPIVYLDEIENYDQKLLNWMKFTLDTIVKDKRKRKTIKLVKYFEHFEKNWRDHLSARGANLILNDIDSNIQLRAFEIDLDTIFNNLVVNSIDAFQRRNAGNVRDIEIKCRIQNRNMKIQYSDTGPGLSKDIKDPNDIFNIYFSTKRDPSTGEEIGTGIGMWLVKNCVEEYKGKVQIDQPKKGFAMSIIIPLGESKS